MATLKSETSKGTDQPWLRPGNVAQDPSHDAPSPSERPDDNADAVDAGRAPYQSKPQTTSFGTSLTVTSNAKGDEGRVGDPLPVVLLAIIAIPIAAVIGGLVWYFFR